MLAVESRLRAFCRCQLAVPNFKWHCLFLAMRIMLKKDRALLSLACIMYLAIIWRQFSIRGRMASGKKFLEGLDEKQP